jgi:hypothetical protein
MGSASGADPILFMLMCAVEDYILSWGRVGRLYAEGGIDACKQDKGPVERG